MYNILSYFFISLIIRFNDNGANLVPFREVISLLFIQNFDAKASPSIMENVNVNVEKVFFVVFAIQGFR